MSKWRNDVIEDVMRAMCLDYAKLVDDVNYYSGNEAAGHAEIGRKAAEIVLRVPSLLHTIDDHKARADRAEAALRDIAMEAERENGGWVHLKRSIAINARAALAALEPKP